MSPQYSADSVSDNEPQEDVQSSLSRLQSPLLSRPLLSVLWGETLLTQVQNQPCVVMEKQFRRLSTPQSLETFSRLNQTNHQPLCCSDELFFSSCFFFFSPLLKTYWWHDEGCCSWTSGTFSRLVFRVQVVSEKSPSNISEMASVSEKDYVHVGVEQCGDEEGPSLAGLREKTETTFTGLVIKVLLDLRYFTDSEGITHHQIIAQKIIWWGWCKMFFLVLYSFTASCKGCVYSASF